MSAALDRLLAELTRPPVPAGLAERVSAAARAAVQEPHAGRARRAGRDRRGRWRRGLAIGAGALGLAVSSAVAATLAGMPLPAKVEAVIAKLPLVGKKAPEAVAQAPRPRPIMRAAASAVVVPEPAIKRPAIDPIRMHEARQLRRLAAAREIVAARRAAGLPTPRADRMERRLERRMEYWRRATPEQRERFLKLRRQRREMRRARIEARQLPSPLAALPPPVALRNDGVEPRPIVQRPVHGPVDPRAERPALTDDQGQRLRQFRAERLERLRERRLERQRVEGARPVPPRRIPTSPPPMRRPAPTRTTR